MPDRIPFGLPHFMPNRRPRRFTKREIARRHRLKKHYGITVEEYQELWDAQQGCCRICGQPESGVCGRNRTARVLAVDHDHSTGNVRGLLCAACNPALGLFRDDVDLLRRAIAYLEEVGS